MKKGRDALRALQVRRRKRFGRETPVFFAMGKGEIPGKTHIVIVHIVAMSNYHRVLASFWWFQFVVPLIQYNILPSMR